MMKNIYYSIIYSHIVYAIQVWGSAGKIETNKILVLQKRTIRLILNKDKRPVKPGTRKTSYKYERIVMNEGVIDNE